MVNDKAAATYHPNKISGSTSEHISQAGYWCELDPQKAQAHALTAIAQLLADLMTKEKSCP